MKYLQISENGINYIETKPVAQLADLAIILDVPATYLRIMNHCFSHHQKVVIHNVKNVESLPLSAITNQGIPIRGTFLVCFLLKSKYSNARFVRMSNGVIDITLNELHIIKGKKNG